MNKRTSSHSKPAASFVAGVLIGVSIVAPVFAATDVIADDWPVLLLAGSIVLLIVGVTFKLVAASRARKSGTTLARPAQSQAAREDLPDLRRDRWPTAVDHSLGISTAPRRQFH